MLPSDPRPVTPEQIAANLVAEAEHAIAEYVTGYPYLAYKGIDELLLERIAAAIRAAELRGLERAEEAIAAIPGDPQTLDHVEAAIARLKESICQSK